MGEFQRWNTHHSHVVPIEVCGHQLNIAQDPTSDNLGTTIWDASVILVRYMERNPQLYSRRKLEGKRVLELGAGCGLAGLYFALQGANVTFTDLIEVVPLLQRNVTMNLGGQAVEPHPDAASSGGAKGKRKGEKAAAPPAARPKAKVLEYDWGKPLDALSPPYDYIVACDCVYVERLVESLVWSMAQCSGRTTTVLVASEKREEITYAKFRERLSKDFTVRQAPRRHMDKAYDHENSEVLVCKLRRANGNSGGGGGKEGRGVDAGGKDKDKDDEPEETGGEEGHSCCCADGGGVVSGEVSGAEGTRDEAKGCPKAAGGAEPRCSDEVDAGSCVEPAASAAASASAADDDTDRLSLAGVSLSSARERVNANGGGPDGKNLSKAVGGGPIRKG